MGGFHHPRCDCIARRSGKAPLPGPGSRPASASPPLRPWLRRLAGTDDDGAPAAIFRQVVGQHLVGWPAATAVLNSSVRKARGSVLMTGSNFLLSCRRSDRRSQRRRRFHSAAPAPAGTGEWKRAPDAEAVISRPGVRFFTPPCGRGRKRAAANTGVRRPFLSRALRKGFVAPRGVTARADCGSLVADREVGHVLQALDQRRVVPVTPPMAAQGAEHLLGVGGVGLVQVQLAGAGQARLRSFGAG